MKTYLANTVLVEYDDIGNGLPVLLLHAFPLARALFRPQIEALTDAFRQIVPDLRGFGGTSPFDGPPSVDRLADDAAALLDALKIATPVVVGGVSMGGYAALAFARRHPARLRGLILADTKAEADTAEGKKARETAIAFAQKHTSAEFVEPMLAKLLGTRTRTERPEVAEEVRRIASLQKTSAIVDALAALRDRPDATPGLSHIACPTLVVVGDEDAITPPDTARTLAAAIPNARLEVLNGAGHLANLERPEEFNAVARRFLEEARAR